jgi:hypothetical protein
MLFTNKKLLHARGACARGYHHFFSHRSPVSDDEPIPLTDVLEVNGIDDALWCLHATTEPCEEFIKLLARVFAEHVLPLFEAKFPDNPAPQRAIETARRAIETARRFARGDYTAYDAYRADEAAVAAARAARAAVAHVAYEVAYANASAEAAAARAVADALGAAQDAAAAAAAVERQWQAKRFKEALLAHPGANGSE